MKKISKWVECPEITAKVQQIVRLLTEYESGILSDITNTNSFSSGLASGQSSSSISVQENNVLPRATSDGAKPSNFWEKLEKLNLDIFVELGGELSLFKEPEHFSSALAFLSTSIDDFPPEFFLQSPHILQSLLDIVRQAPTESARKVVQMIRSIVNGLKDRCLEAPAWASEPDENIGSVKKHINNILRMLASFFERFHSDFSPLYFAQHQEVLNEIYRLLFDLARFISRTQNACEIFLNELLNSMAKIAKDLRTSYAATRSDSGWIRLHYISVIYIINVLVTTVDTNNISAYCENNLWAFESDVALLDGPLKISHSKVYSLVWANREGYIKDDKDLMQLLNINECWKPSVELFQRWERMTGDEIIFKGLEAIDTIRMHRSAELVKLLLNTIKKCARHFSENVKLREAAEEIYLRLLSIEAPEIRKQVYNIASSYVRERFLEDECPEDASLCDIIGIPLTTEIVTEIVCFSSIDDDEEIRNNSRLILNSLLRAKVTFKNHWPTILNVMKPILPLMTAMFDIDTKMGWFVVDLHHQHSGFNQLELDQGFARFLFSGNARARLLAKTKILQQLDVDDQMSQIVPDDFCILPAASVVALQMPRAAISYDREAYESICQALREADRSNIDLMQTILVQLNSMMESRSLCQQSHDDNIWVFFLASLDMGFPNSIPIRDLTLKILYKWVVCISTFRDYLAHEPSVLNFLINTLVEYQNEEAVKKYATWLLFILLFSDFVVITETSISLPAFLDVMRCPFKFNHHWTESPFNKISALEHLDEKVENDDDAPEIREIYQKYIKFNFALEWFQTVDRLVSMKKFGSQSYYENLSSNTFEVCSRLQISAADITQIRQTISKAILEDLGSRLDKTESIQEAQSIILQIQTLLIMPITSEEELAEQIHSRIERLLVYDILSTSQQKMFTGFLQIYQRIVGSLKNESIVRIATKKFFIEFIMGNVQFAVEPLIEGLNLLRLIITLCFKRPDLASMLIKAFEKLEKVHLPTRLLEKLANFLFSTVMRDDKWHEAGRRPIVKVILTTMRTVLNAMPTQLDDAYLTNLFHQLLGVPMRLYSMHREHIKSSHPLHINSSIAKQIFAVMLSIASRVDGLELRADRFQQFTLWATQHGKKYKALLWMIVAQLTKKKEGLLSFAKVYQDTMNINLFDDLTFLLLDPNMMLSRVDQKAIVTVIGNILNFAPESTGCPRNLEKIVVKLLQSNNINALSFLVKKLIQNDHQKIEIVVQHNLIAKLLDFKIAAEAYQSITERLETVLTSYMHASLKQHVAEQISNADSVKFVFLMLDSRLVNESFFKRFARAAFNIILIMIKSEAGMLRFSQMLQRPRNIEQLILTSHEILRVSNPYSEIMFQLGFWNSLIDKTAAYNSPALDLIILHHLSTEKQQNHVRYGIDLLFTQIVSIFESSFASKHSAECELIVDGIFLISKVSSILDKHDMNALCYTLITKLSSRSERCREIAEHICLLETVCEKVDLSLGVMQNFRYLETTKKHGVQKVRSHNLRFLCTNDFSISRTSS